MITNGLSKTTHILPTILPKTLVFANKNHQKLYEIMCNKVSIIQKSNEFIPTAFYVIRNIRNGDIKCGFHTGTNHELITRYQTYIVPEIIYICRSVDAYQFEQDFHAYMDTMRIRRIGVDGIVKSIKAEIYGCDETTILRGIAELVDKYETKKYSDLYDDMCIEMQKMINV
jgi:hypothetical protein